MWFNTSHWFQVLWHCDVQCKGHMDTKLLCGPQSYTPPNWGQAEDKAGPGWSKMVSSIWFGVPEEAQQSNRSQWEAAAISSLECCVMMFPVKPRVQQVRTFRAQVISVQSYPSCLSYNRCRNTFLAQLHEFNSISLCINYTNTLKPALLLSNLTLQLGQMRVDKKGQTDLLLRFEEYLH